MAKKKTYAGGISHASAQKVDAIFTKEKKATGKTISGNDLRTGQKKKDQHERRKK